MNARQATGPLAMTFGRETPACRRAYAPLTGVVGL